MALVALLALFESEYLCQGRNVFVPVNFDGFLPAQKLDLETGEFRRAVPQGRDDGNAVEIHPHRDLLIVGETEKGTGKFRRVWHQLSFIPEIISRWFASSTDDDPIAEFQKEPDPEGAFDEHLIDRIRDFYEWWIAKAKGGCLGHA